MRLKLGTFGVYCGYEGHDSKRPHAMTARADKPAEIKPKTKPRPLCGKRRPGPEHSEPDKPDTLKKAASRPETSDRLVRTGIWKDDLVAALAVCPVVGKACQFAGISRSQAYACRGRDPEFAARWDDALEDGIDNLEYALHERALDTDTTAAIFLLKSLRPEKFRDRYEVTGNIKIGDVELVIQAMVDLMHRFVPRERRVEFMAEMEDTVKRLGVPKLLAPSSGDPETPPIPPVDRNVKGPS